MSNFENINNESNDDKEPIVAQKNVGDLLFPVMSNEKMEKFLLLNHGILVMGMLKMKIFIL